jgi:hypothetical protein
VYIKYLAYQRKHFKGQFQGIRPIEEPRKRRENGVWFDAAIFIRIQHYQELATMKREDWR